MSSTMRAERERERKKKEPESMRKRERFEYCIIFEELRAWLADVQVAVEHFYPTLGNKQVFLVTGASL